MSKKGGSPNQPANNLANNGVYVLMDEITMGSCADCLKWIMNHNLAETRLPQLTIIINSPGGDVHAAFALIDTMKASTILAFNVSIRANAAWTSPPGEFIIKVKCGSLLSPKL